MAYRKVFSGIRVRYNKQGEINSYQVRLYLGKDVTVKIRMYISV